jgi:hypothetical protein
MVDNKFTRWNDKIHHPRERCEGVCKSGPCPYIKAEGTNFCPMHGSNSGRIARNEETQRNYRLNRWQQRVEDFADNDQIKSLREEIGILRMMMEEMLIKCTDTTELMLYSHRISDLAMKIEKLVISCDKIENRMGLLLSKRAILQLAGTYVNIINTHVADPDIIETISEEMLEATKLIENPVDKLTVNG